MTQLQRHLQDRLLTALQGLGLPRAQAEPLVVLQPPKNREHGDTALGAFQLAKALGKAPPQLATELAAAITADDVVESAQAAGPFVNFRFRRSALAKDVLSDILAGAAPYGPAASNG